MKQLKFIAPLLLLTMLSVGCAARYIGVTDYQMGKGKTKINRDKAYNVVSGILVDNGFDIKMANKDIGVITTEWKKYGEIKGQPPFDLYLMVKIQIKESEGSPDRAVITLTPSNKHVNRLNPAAFTERPLQYFDEASQKGYLAPDEEIKLKGYSMYINVVTKIFDALKLSTAKEDDDFIFNTQWYEEQLIDTLK